MSAHAERLLKHAAIRYLVAIAAVVVALILWLLLEPWTGGGAPFALTFAGVLAVSLLVGVGPGFLTLALSLPLAAYLSVTRTGTPVSQVASQGALATADGIIILYLAWLERRRRRSLDDANRELRRLTDEAEQSEAHARQIIELSPDAFFLADLEARFTDVNRAACELLGYTREELLDKTIFEIIPASDAQRLKDVRDDLLVPDAIQKGEWTLKRKDGTTVPVDASANILSDGRWQAFVRDITERRRIEDQRQVFVSLLDNSVDFIGVADPGGKPIYLNAAGRRMVGLAPDFPVETLQIQECYPPDLRPFVTDVLLKTMLEKGVWSGETFFQHFQTHARIPVSDTHFMIRDASGERVLGMGTVTRDITDRRKVEEALQRAVADRNDVLRIVAHDLRNPLSTIMMEAQILESPGLVTVKRDSTPAEVILRSVKRMNQLIQDLLDVALVEAGELKVEQARHSAAAVVREAVESQATIAADSKIEIRLEIDPAIREVWCWCDHKRLLQVFENLIGNAIKFTEAGGRITVRGVSQEHDVLFSVADTGCGIEADALPHVFERFWQASTHARHMGAGLGLPVAKGIVEAHGGRMWVESVPGRGSTFYFTIPKS
jgi:PAS domain S-box-containing protein